MTLSMRVSLLGALFLMVGGGLLVVHPVTRHIPYALRVLPWVEPGWGQERRTFAAAVSATISLVRRAKVEFAAAATSGLLIILATGNFIAAMAVSCCIFASIGFVRQQHTAQTVRKQSARIASELPAIAEYLALCSSAGLSIEAAVRRVPSDFTGLIADAIADATDDRKSALEALAQLAKNSTELRQLLDALELSRMRGTPIAHVLGQQATQMRSHEQQQLLARSGRQEVLMLVPVIFLVFPTVIGVALFPGWQELKHLAW
jgi:tight adherence protein C